MIRRLEWDKPMAGSTIQIQVQPGGVVYLRGSVRSPGHKQRAAALVESTVGVASVVDELAVVKEVKVIQAKSTTRVMEVATPARTSQLSSSSRDPRVDQSRGRRVSVRGVRRPLFVDDSSPDADRPPDYAAALAAWIDGGGDGRMKVMPSPAHSPGPNS